MPLLNLKVGDRVIMQDGRDWHPFSGVEFVVIRVERGFWWDVEGKLHTCLDYVWRVVEPSGPW